MIVYNNDDDNDKDDNDKYFYCRRIKNLLKKYLFYLLRIMRMIEEFL